jgi:hypothetical protein
MTLEKKGIVERSKETRARSKEIRSDSRNLVTAARQLVNESKELKESSTFRAKPKNKSKTVKMAS